MGKAKNGRQTLFDFKEQNGEKTGKEMPKDNHRVDTNGNIKKKKTLIEIKKEEIPFEIPENWTWVRLGSIGYTNIGLTYSPKDVNKEGTIVLRSCNIQDGKIDYTDTVQVKMDIPDNKMCHKGDILICARNGSKKLVGKSAIIDREGMSFGAFMAIFRSIYNNYILYVINSPFFKNSLFDVIGTTTINQITQACLKNALIPLPPLPEQKRIVALIESLFSRLDEARAKAQKVIDGFEPWKSAVLHKAFTGQLVEQRPEEGTGEELYREIQAEKKRLAKKEKPLPEIKEDEIPFEIPEGWKWVRLGEIATIQSSKRVFERDYVAEGIPFFRSKEIGILCRNETIHTNLYITKEHYESLKTRYGVPQVGDILLTSVGSIGNSWLCDGREFYYKDGNVTQICNNCYFFSPYVKHFISSPLFSQQVNATVSGTAYNALTIIKLNNLLLPLPPLSEQKRIASQIESLFSRMEEAVEKAKSVIEQIDVIKKSILAKAFRGELGTNDPTEESALEILKSSGAESKKRAS